MFKIKGGIYDFPNNSNNDYRYVHIPLSLGNRAYSYASSVHPKPV